MKKTIFWSWQSDLEPSTTRNFVKKSIEKAIKKINKDFVIDDRKEPTIEIDHDTKNEAGLPEIVGTIFKKIDDCSIFIADITPIIKTSKEKEIANPNVMIELGYALKSLGHQKIITITNLHHGGSPENLPFDLKHRRGPISYNLSDKTEESDKKKGAECLTDNLYAAIKAILKEESNINQEEVLPKFEIENVNIVPSQNIKSLEEIKKDTPKFTLTKLRKTKTFTKIMSPYSIIFGSSVIKAQSEWDEDDINQVNQKIENYYAKYEEYLEKHKQWLELQKMIFKVEINLYNKLKKPLEKVLVILSFPKHINLSKKNDFHKIPNVPALPDCNVYIQNPNNYARGHASNIQFEIPDVEYFTIDLESKYKNTIIFKALPKVSHHCPEKLCPFYIFIDTDQGSFNFNIEYKIICDDLQNIIEGYKQTSLNH